MKHTLNRIYTRRKYFRILLIAAFVALIGGWQIHSRRKAIRQTLETTASFIPVETRIEKIFPSGRGYRRSTIITVNYMYEGRKYTKTVTRAGYAEGQYHKGDTLTLYLNPANPDEIIDKVALKYNF
jgi:hypothetical protein